MGYEWSRRPYTAPFFRDLIFTNDAAGHCADASGDSGHCAASCSFRRHVPFSKRVSTLALKEKNGGHFGDNGGNPSTLSIASLVPCTTFGSQCTNEMRGTDIFFLPKPSQLLAFALPVFVMMPNLTVFARQWFFYAPK